MKVQHSGVPLKPIPLLAPLPPKVNVLVSASFLLIVFGERALMRCGIHSEVSEIVDYGKDLLSNPWSLLVFKIVFCSRLKTVYQPCP